MKRYLHYILSLVLSLALGAPCLADEPVAGFRSISVSASSITGVVPIANGGTNNGSLGVSATAVVTGDGSKLVQTANGTALQQLRVNAGGTAIEWFTPSAAGTVTDFSATPTSVFDVATSTTTPALSLDSQTGTGAAGKGLMSPVGGGAGVPAFRILDAQDIPSLNTSILTAGTLPIARGGTNNGSLGVSAVGIYNGNGSAIAQTTGTASQMFRVNAGGTAIEAFTFAAGDVASGVFPIARGGTNNGSLGVSALGIYNGDGSKVVQTTAAANQSWRVNAGGTAVEAFTPGTGTVTSIGLAQSGLSFLGFSADITTSGDVTITPTGTTGDSLYFSGTNTVSLRAIGTGQNNTSKVVSGVPNWSTPWAFKSTGQTITSGTPATVAHGLSYTPQIIMCMLKCTTADLGYEVGDEVIYYPHGAQGQNTGVLVTADGTNINYVCGSAAGAFQLLNEGTGSGASITNSRWDLYFYAF